MSEVKLTQQAFNEFRTAMAGYDQRLRVQETAKEQGQIQQQQIASGLAQVQQEVNQLRLQLDAARAAATPMDSSSRGRKSVTESGLYKSFAKYSGDPAEHHDWAFNAKRVLIKADPDFGGAML